MNYKMYLYVITLIMSVYILNGVHFEKIMKAGKEFEAKALFIALTIMMSYILTNFIVDFLEVSKIF